MQPIKVGILGSGFAARFHYDALQRVYGVKLRIIGAYSRSPENLKPFCDEKNISAFPSVEDLISEADVLHVCTPPVTQENLIVKILKKDKYVIVEKPLTGYFGEEDDQFSGDTFPRETRLEKAIASINNIIKPEEKSKAKVLYAENWIYAPAIQKEKEVIEKTKSQILWIQAQQFHSGSHSSAYGKWKLSGGGSLMGKGCHPIAGALYR